MCHISSLAFQPFIEELGEKFWDIVEPAVFPHSQLRFRNNFILEQLGLNCYAITDSEIEATFGRFEGRSPLLALRYHGYQFGTYNPFLGDGRGFLYGQLADTRGNLQDLGTKGSGTTPWSRGGDGRLTLKGGVREIIASEALHRLGVTTSRTLSLVETGEELWRGDESSPTRSSVIVRIARTHLRFGTCERLLYQNDSQGLERLLLFVIALYYPEVADVYPADCSSKAALQQHLVAFYAELVNRVAKLAAEWMAAGFTHGVLNTDNMSLAGEGLDYGPYAFLDRWDPKFTATHFDQTGLYAYGQQPTICRHNLRLLQEPLTMLLPRELMEERLEQFTNIYEQHHKICFLRRLGLTPDFATEGKELVAATLNLLAKWPVDYGQFFSGLAKYVSADGIPDKFESLLPFLNKAPEPTRKSWLYWRDTWLYQLRRLSPSDNSRKAVANRLQRWNLSHVPNRSLIEGLWQAIDEYDDWKPLRDWLTEVMIS